MAVIQNSHHAEINKSEYAAYESTALATHKTNNPSDSSATEYSPKMHSNDPNKVWVLARDEHAQRLISPTLDPALFNTSIEAISLGHDPREVDGVTENTMQAIGGQFKPILHADAVHKQNNFLPINGKFTYVIDNLNGVL